MPDYFTARDLLKPPTERAAFSDRQAYVCAELAQLAYFKFEGGHTLDQVLALTRRIVDDDEKFAVLEVGLKSLLATDPATETSSKEALAMILKSAGFSLVDTWSEKGTAAFICTRSIDLDDRGNKQIGYLAFRGTEPKDFRDIKTDISARLTDVPAPDGDTLQLHKGYITALGHVDKQIKEKIGETAIDQLFVTGHSLGGALAILYTRLHAASDSGACYTFGAPPVGTVDVQNRLKTPVYEIVNEIDIVPRLPNPWVSSLTVVLINLIRLLGKSVTLLNSALAAGTWDERFEDYIRMMTRYRHPGYVSYLVGPESSARLRYNVSGFDKARWWLAMLFGSGFGRFGKPLSDHSISVYVEKLKTHGLNRQS